MKSFAIRSTALSVFLAAQAVAADTTVVLSALGDKQALERKVAFTKSIYTKLPLGERMSIVADGEVLTSLIVPNHKAYTDNPRGRLKANRKALKPLNDLPETASNEAVTNNIDVPRVLNEIGIYHTNTTDIVVLASPFYFNSHHLGLDMRDGSIPSDGYILALPSESPFGTKGIEERLKGKRVHWLLPKAFENTLHAHIVQRFWHLYISRQGGALVSFTHSEDSVLQRLIDNAEALDNSFDIDESGKLEVLRVKTIVSKAAITEMPASETASAITDYKQTLTLSIEWNDANVDLDIWAKPAEGNVLYYRRNASPQGRHYKDVLRGGTRHHETIDFHKNVDIRKLLVVVNVYHAPVLSEVSGTIKVELSGRVYESAFHFEASRGNRGKDVATLLAGGNDTLYSKRFPILAMVNLEKDSSRARGGLQ